MTDLFQFEADFVNNLQCIPMQVRLKLDTCGIKLKLNQWNILSDTEKKELIILKCSTSEEINSYRRFLQQIIQEKTGKDVTELNIDPYPAWLNIKEIPQIVVDKIREEKLNLTIEIWSNLKPLQRFALIKLSASGHENKNFFAACQEFGLVK